MATNITADQYAIAKNYSDQGDYSGGWRYLSSIGDNYADNAYAVASGNTSGSWDELMHAFVKSYWDTVAGENAYAEKFDSVARQHFEQYVDLIGQNNFQLPNSQQIEQSYRDAVTGNGLPPETAIDGSITRGIGELLGKQLDWPDALGMEGSRKVSSDVFNDLDPQMARQNLLDATGGVKDQLLDWVKNLLKKNEGILCDLNPELCDLFNRARMFFLRSDPLAACRA